MFIACSKHESAVLSCSVMSNVQLFATPWTAAHQAPLAKGILQARKLGVGCHALLQGIFTTQGSNAGLPHCRQILYHLNHQGSPNTSLMCCNLDTVNIESTCLASDKADTEQTTLISNTRNQSYLQKLKTPLRPFSL